MSWADRFTLLRLWASLMVITWVLVGCGRLLVRDIRDTSRSVIRRASVWIMILVSGPLASLVIVAFNGSPFAVLGVFVAGVFLLIPVLIYSEGPNTKKEKNNERDGGNTVVR